MMQEFHLIEYCDMELRLGRPDLERFIAQLARHGVSMYWKDVEEYLILVASTGLEKQEFRFQQPHAGQFVLTGTVTVTDDRLASALQMALERTKGNAVVKTFSEGPLLIVKFQNGEAMTIMELHGPRKKVVYEKPIKVTSEDVMRAFKSRDVEKRIPVLKLELDYELMSLQDALTSQNEAEARRVRARLQELHQELMMYEVYSYENTEV